MKKWKNGVILVAWLAIMLALVPVAAITVSTEKDTYYPGEQLVISGLATPNALVSIVIENPNGALVALDQVRVGDDGTYSAAPLSFPSEANNLFPFGTYTITVKDTATGEEATATVQFVSPLATIRGTVIDEAGNPVEGATVTVLMDGATVAVDVTDASGAYEVTVGEVGTYTVRVEKDGFITVEETIDVTNIPGTFTADVVLTTQKLSVVIEAITRDGKPLFGVAREGETLEVKAKVYYGNTEVSDATVRGYLTSGPRAAMGLPPIEFELTYDADIGMFVGSVQIPAPGLDRTCMLTVEATYGEETASQTIEFITLVNVGQQVADLEGQVTDLESRLGDLEGQTAQLSDQVTSLSGTVGQLTDQINQLTGSLGQLQNNLNSLQTQLNTLQATVQNLQAQLGDLAKKTDVDNVRNEVNLVRDDVNNLKNTINALQSQLNQLQNNLNQLQSNVDALNQKLGNLDNKLANLESQVNDLNNKVQAVSGAKGLAQAGIAVGIIAILIALGVMFFINKKISA